ncbi:MAG: dihydroorotate dehydrogenase [Candidatus Zixiibacteriota bacterium]
MTVDLRVNIAGVEFANPIMTASGCCGYGDELATIFPLSKLGALVTKSITQNPRLGHKPPRVAEATMSMLNAIGLANVGIDAFVTDKIPFLNKQKTKIIVNVAGWSIEDYTSVCARLNDIPRVDMVELNFSCPNVESGLEFSSDATQMERAVRAVKNVFSRPIVAKLSPNVTNIVDIAKGAEQGGADAVSLINSLIGTAIDIETWRPRLTNNTGGLTGPAVKPIALAMVNKVHNQCRLPIIGIGGIRTADDVVEFLLCGATAVQVGTALFVEPSAPVTIAKGLADYLKRKKISSVSQLVGKVVRH